MATTTLCSCRCRRCLRCRRHRRCLEKRRRCAPQSQNRLLCARFSHTLLLFNALRTRKISAFAVVVVVVVELSGYFDERARQRNQSAATPITRARVRTRPSSASTATTRYSFGAHLARARSLASDCRERHSTIVRARGSNEDDGGAFYRWRSSLFARFAPPPPRFLVDECVQMAI